METTAHEVGREVRRCPHALCSQERDSGSRRWRIRKCHRERRLIPRPWQQELERERCPWVVVGGLGPAKRLKNAKPRSPWWWVGDGTRRRLESWNWKGLISVQWQCKQTGMPNFKPCLRQCLRRHVVDLRIGQLANKRGSGTGCVRDATSGLAEFTLPGNAAARKHNNLEATQVIRAI